MALRQLPRGTRPCLRFETRRWMEGLVMLLRFGHFTMEQERQIGLRRQQQSSGLSASELADLFYVLPYVSLRSLR